MTKPLHVRHEAGLRIILMYRNVEVKLRKTIPANCALRTKCEPRSKPYITRVNVISAQMSMYRNVKVRLRIAEGLRKVRTTLNVSVYTGLMIIAHALIYRFIEVDCAMSVKNSA